MRIKFGLFKVYYIFTPHNKRKATDTKAIKTMYTQQEETQTQDLGQKIAEAKKLFGLENVETALTLVEFCDPDGAYTTLQDMGQFEIAEVISFIFFE